jgi:hypothetical protein
MRSLQRPRILLCLLVILPVACGGGGEAAEVREVVAAFFGSIAEEDLEAAEELFWDVPEGSLALLSPAGSPRSAVADYSIRRVRISSEEGAEAAVAVPGPTGTTVLIFSLRKVDGEWYLEDDIRARVELGSPPEAGS